MSNRTDYEIYLIFWAKSKLMLLLSPLNNGCPDNQGWSIIPSFTSFTLSFHLVFIGNLNVCIDSGMFPYALYMSQGKIVATRWHQQNLYGTCYPFLLPSWNYDDQCVFDLKITASSHPTQPIISWDDQTGNLSEATKTSPEFLHPREKDRGDDDLRLLTQSV